MKNDSFPELRRKLEERGFKFVPVSDPYRWCFGKIGERLVQKSDFVTSLLKKGYEVIDGHEPELKFANLLTVRHLDIVVLETKTKTIKAICEVKTTRDPKRTEFGSHGACITSSPSDT